MWNVSPMWYFNEMLSMWNKLWKYTTSWVRCCYASAFAVMLAVVIIMHQHFSRCYCCVFATKPNTTIFKNTTILNAFYAKYSLQCSICIHKFTIYQQRPQTTDAKRDFESLLTDFIFHLFMCIVYIKPVLLEFWLFSSSSSSSSDYYYFCFECYGRYFSVSNIRYEVTLSLCIND